VLSDDGIKIFHRWRLGGAIRVVLGSPGYLLGDVVVDDDGHGVVEGPDIDNH
jgi:hypothetical protein